MLDVMERTIMFQPVAIRGNVIVSSFILPPNDIRKRPTHSLSLFLGRALDELEGQSRGTMMFKIGLLFWRDTTTRVLSVRFPASLVRHGSLSAFIAAKHACSVTSVSLPAPYPRINGSSAPFGCFRSERSE